MEKLIEKHKKKLSKKGQIAFQLVYDQLKGLSVNDAKNLLDRMRIYIEEANTVT